MAEKKSTLTEDIEQQRRKLLGADGVIICIQRGIDSMQAPPDAMRVGDALQVASDIINDAVEALEVIAGKHAPTGAPTATRAVAALDDLGGPA